jgi:hypothetical protein
MANKVYVAKCDFLPESARKSFHVDVKKGDRLVVEAEYDHGDMTRLGDTPVFLSEEDIYRYCEVEKA